MDSSIVQNVLEGIFSAAFLASILRVATPILLPSLGALISDRAGVINIGLEGTMLIAAFTGVVFSAYSRDWFGDDTARTIGPWVGMAAGMMMGVLVALLLGFFHLKLKANLILSGIAINFLGQAATVVVMYELTGDRGTTQGGLKSMRMPFIQLPEWLNDIPGGAFFFKVFDNQSIMTWIAILAVFVVWYFMYRTPVGIHLRAVGENPNAAASVGIRVQRIRYLALMLSGILSALGGIHLSMGYLTFFQNNMSSGRGYIALAAPALGGGHPVGTGFAAFIFAFFEALSIRIGTLDIPSMLPQMLPYIATIMALVIYALQSQLTVRVRTLRSAEGERFDASFWKAIQRLSVLHMFMAMVAVLGIIVCLSMYAAPDGFKSLVQNWDEMDVRLYGGLIGLLSLALILINLPFMLNVERIGQRIWFSAATSIAALWLYLGLLLMLFLRTTSLKEGSLPGGFVLGLGVAVGLWVLLGGRYLLQNRRQVAAAA
jgi:simple sugar transport system permease protein